MNVIRIEEYKKNGKKWELQNEYEERTIINNMLMNDLFYKYVIKTDNIKKITYSYDQIEVFYKNPLKTIYYLGR